MKMRTIAALLAMPILITFAGCDKSSDSLNKADKEFMERTAYANNSAVEFGNLAASKGNDPSVRAFGQAMVTEYNAAKDELKALAGERNYKLPSNPDGEHLALKIVLNNKSGRAFDSIYMKGQVYDHTQTMGIFLDVLDDGQDQALKDYANKHMPKAETHKTTAESIVTAMKF